eukprot:scaffold3437_cov439-Pavlova_lutheri.AAC.2
MAGGDRQNTCASSNPRSRPPKRRSKSKKASSPPNRLELADRSTVGHPRRPRISTIASLPNRKLPCSSSSVKDSALRPGLGGGSLGLHHSWSVRRRSLHSLASTSRMAVNATRRSGS